MDIRTVANFLDTGGFNNHFNNIRKLFRVLNIFFFSLLIALAAPFF